MTASKRWEYKVEEFTHTTGIVGGGEFRETFPAFLDSLGDDGWELVGLDMRITPYWNSVSYNVTIVFKRPKQQEEKEMKDD